MLARFQEWYTVELRSTSRLDPEFCTKFTEQVLKIYNVEQISGSNFTVFPKKVSKKSPKVMLGFKRPVDSEMSVRLELSSGREKKVIDGIKMENPYTAYIKLPG